MFTYIYFALNIDFFITKYKKPKIGCSFLKNGKRTDYLGLRFSHTKAENSETGIQIQFYTDKALILSKILLHKKICDMAMI